MMPPNAQNILGTVAGTTEVTTPSATNATYTPIFSDDAIDHSQAEVAKTFHWREFGNGSANGNASYEDFSTLSGTEDARAYVMDDGLTSMSAIKPSSYTDGLGLGNSNGDAPTEGYITFIGTGIHILDKTTGSGSMQSVPLVQNLPYGTHILKMVRQTWPDFDYIIDGVQIDYNHANSASGYKWEFSFHQPKMPPIPEDAVIIADYMLMADFVPRSDSSANIGLISKGVRRSNMSRDWFFENTSGNGLSLALNVTESSSGFSAGFGQGSGNQYKSQLPSFCTNFVATGYSVSTRCNLFIDDVDTAPTAIGGGNGSYGRLTSNVTLGLHTVRTSEFASGYNTAYDFDLATPIHTSSHYQTFETPFLHELVGGDRNMEQTNLVVTPDGKTWDEVTRDVSYIGNTRVHAMRDGGDIAATGSFIHDIWRGGTANDAGAPGRQQYYNKDFAIAYDRLVCLVDGQYEITARYYTESTGNTINIRINNAIVNSIYDNVQYTHCSFLWNCFLNRGDTVDIYVNGGTFRGTADNQWLTGLMIKRI
jgi:hypothetical protein